MNQKNKDLFFGNDENVVITLTDEDGTDTDVALIASFEVEELGTEYIMVVEMDETGEGITDQMQVLKYEEDEAGEPEISSIDDEEEYELATEACRQIIKSGAIEGFDVEDDDGEEYDADYSDDYLSDIGTIFPGLSIDRDEE